jgi:hypothetical protein
MVEVGGVRGDAVGERSLDGRRFKAMSVNRRFFDRFLLALFVPRLSIIPAVARPLTVYLPAASRNSRRSTTPCAPCVAFFRFMERVQPLLA